MSARPTEHEIQATVFEWRARMVNQHPDLRWMYAIPNGGLRDGVTAKKMQREGVTRGVPDICVPVPRHAWLAGASRLQYCGLYIEVKTTAGELSDEQAEWIDGLRTLGYKAEVTRGVDATIDAICGYLNIERGY